jgi:hypothetical protein
LNFASTLSAWGAVVIPGGTGFAMEFIGDLSDTIAIGTVTAATAEVGL